MGACGVHHNSYLVSLNLLSRSGQEHLLSCPRFSNLDLQNKSHFFIIPFAVPLFVSDEIAFLAQWLIILG